MGNKLFLGDNLEILKNIDTESVDLIYLDPPFFSNREYNVIWKGDSGEVRSFQDVWEGGIDTYINWLHVRVEQMHRVLKPTGSIFLHCDWHADAYIRVYVLDKIFGEKSLVNEITWSYKTYLGRVDSLQYFPRKSDTIFFYTKGKRYTFNGIPSLDNFAGTVDGTRWEKYLVNNQILEGRHPKTDSRFMQYRDKWIREHGRKPRKGEVIYECKGDIITDNWSDIKAVDPKSHERIGYPTQKPEALLARIINCASNTGDLILDPFVGGGTTVAVAAKLGRKFIGIDSSYVALKVTERRLQSCRELFSDANFAFRIIPPILTEDEYQDMSGAKKGFDFQKVIIEAFGGSCGKRGADGGIDGRKDGLPIQVKNWKTPVSSDEIQKLHSVMLTAGKKKGYFIAENFSRQAIAKIAELQRIGLDIERVSPRDIIKVVPTLDDKYKFIRGEEDDADKDAQ